MFVKIAQLISLVVVLALLSGCAKKEEKSKAPSQEIQEPEAEAQAPNIKPSKPEVAKAEEYKAVDSSELNFGLMGFSGGTEIGEGGVRILGGTFGKFLCEGSEIACTTDKVEAGMIDTRDYGKIKMSAGTFGGLTVYLTPSQKEKLLVFKKSAEKK
ncbi:MAG: hypothetical protein NTX52_06870 [Planctomycetota bacterium]|nr:hypothetical protein [Planctomycetota bacterium]